MVCFGDLCLKQSLTSVFLAIVEADEHTTKVSMLKHQCALVACWPGHMLLCVLTACGSTSLPTCVTDTCRIGCSRLHCHGLPGDTCEKGLGLHTTQKNLRWLLFTAVKLSAEWLLCSAWLCLGCRTVLVARAVHLFWTTGKEAEGKAEKVTEHAIRACQRLRPATHP